MTENISPQGIIKQKENMTYCNKITPIFCQCAILMSVFGKRRIISTARALILRVSRWWIVTRFTVWNKKRIHTDSGRLCSFSLLGNRVLVGTPLRNTRSDPCILNGACVIFRREKNKQVKKNQLKKQWMLNYGLWQVRKCITVAFQRHTGNRGRVAVCKHMHKIIPHPTLANRV